MNGDQDQVGARRRSFTRLLPILAVLIGLIPFVWPELPPLIDLPAHMARYRVQLDLAGSEHLQRYFSFDWALFGNLGADLLVQPLAPLVGLERAVKLVVLASVGGTMAGLLWVARELHGRITAPAYAALALAYNYSLFYGFLNYCLAMAAALLAFALWLNLARRGLWRTRAAVFLLLGFLVWIGHLVAWVALGAICFAAELVRRRRAGDGAGLAVARALVLCLPLALPAVITLVWLGGVASPGFRIDWGEKAEWLAMLQRDRWIAFDIASALLLYALLALPLRRSWGVRIDGIAAAGALLLFLIFLLSPMQTGIGAANAGSNAGERLIPYAVALALVGLRANEAPAGLKRALAIAIPSFLLVRLAGLTASAALYDHSWQTRLVALESVKPGAAVAAFVGRDCPGDPLGWYRARLDHLPSMVTVQRHGFSNDQFATPGAQLLAVHYEEAGAFRHDPSHRIARVTCAGARAGQEMPSLDTVLAGLPRGAFQYLWVMDLPGAGDRREPWLVKLWDGPDAALYRIVG